MLGAHARRPAAVVHQRPRHAVVDRALELQTVVDVRGVRLAAAHAQLKLDDVGGADVHRVRQQVARLARLVRARETDKTTHNHIIVINMICLFYIESKIHIVRSILH